MAGRRRTHTRGIEPKPASEPLNAPHPGCCEPYPDATFKDGVLIKISAHHQGPRCKGYLEPISIRDFYEAIDAGRAVRGDVG